MKSRKSHGSAISTAEPAWMSAVIGALGGYALGSMALSMLKPAPTPPRHPWPVYAAAWREVVACDPLRLSARGLLCFRGGWEDGLFRLAREAHQQRVNREAMRRSERYPFAEVRP